MQILRAEGPLGIMVMSVTTTCLAEESSEDSLVANVCVPNSQHYLVKFGRAEKGKLNI